jgi:hypothetical protein
VARSTMRGFAGGIQVAGIWTRRGPCAAVKVARGRIAEGRRLAGQSRRPVLLRLPRSEAMGGRVEVMEPR